MPVQTKEPVFHEAVAGPLFLISTEELGHPAVEVQIAKHILGDTPPTYEYLQNILDDVVRLKCWSQKAAAASRISTHERKLPRNKLPRNWAQCALVDDLIAIWSTLTGREPDSTKPFSGEIQGEFVTFAHAAAKALGIYLLRRGNPFQSEASPFTYPGIKGPLLWTHFAHPYFLNLP